MDTAVRASHDIARHLDQGYERKAGAQPSVGQQVPIRCEPTPMKGNQDETYRSATLAITRMSVSWKHAASEGSLVNILPPHLATVAILAACHLQPSRPLAAARMTVEAVATMTMIVVILVIVATAAVVRAVQSVLGLLAQLMQVVSALVAVRCSMVISVVLVVGLLLHH